MMIDPADLDDADLALLLWYLTPSGEEEVTAYFGRCDWDGDSLVWSNDSGASLEIREEWLPRITETDPDVADIIHGYPFFSAYLLATSPRMPKVSGGPDFAGLTKGIGSK